MGNDNNKRNWAQIGKTALVDVCAFYVQTSANTRIIQLM